MPKDQESPALLVLVKGHPGVGKSTLAKLVCRQLRWPLIDKDDARDCLQQLSPDVLQQLDANALSYDIMFRYCATQLSLGLSTAMDCPFARVALYDRALEVAHTHQAHVVVVECTAGNEQVWREQLEARGRQQSGALQAHKPQTWQDLQQLLDRYDNCHQWTRDGSRTVQHLCTVDTTGKSMQEASQHVLSYLASVREKLDAATTQSEHALGNGAGAVSALAATPVTCDEPSVK